MPRSATVIALVAFGVVMVYSASAVFASQRFDDGQYFLVRQGVFAPLGLAADGRARARRLPPPARRSPIRSCWRRVALLLVTSRSASGTARGGAARWIALGPIHVQPAEIAKVAMIFWLAYSLSKKASASARSRSASCRTCSWPACSMLLCLKQPDFGSAVDDRAAHVRAALRRRRAHRLHRSAPAARRCRVGLRARRRLRVPHARASSAFLDPFEYRHDVGYQIAESLISFGSGGVDRRRHRRQPPEAVLPARGAHRLHQRDRRRGARPHRHRAAGRRASSIIVGARPARGVPRAPTTTAPTSRSASRCSSACRRSRTSRW